MVAAVLTEAPAPGVLHPDPYHSYPHGTPRMERLPSDFLDNEHTAATWEAFITSPAVVEANAILAAAEQLQEQLNTWLAKHADDKDPGAAVIKAAGLPLPRPLAEYGTEMRHVRHNFAGLAWAVGTAVSGLDVVPNSDDPQNDPANIRRLLGLAGQEEAR